MKTALNRWRSLWFGRADMGRERAMATCTAAVRMAAPHAAVQHMFP